MKYQRFTQSGYKDIEIRKFEYAARTHFICISNLYGFLFCSYAYFLGHPVDTDEHRWINSDFCLEKSLILTISFPLNLTSLLNWDSQLNVVELRKRG